MSRHRSKVEVDLYIKSRSLIESPHVPSYLTALVMFAQSMTHFRDIRSGNVNGLDLDLYNEPRSNLNILIDDSYFATSSLMEIVMLAISFTVCEIFSQNAPDLDIDL